ncbi:unnamed protein product [Thelazia callipaeda]|uniref:HELICc2 domain-containing protein n=1 Tax=Thelazia callipaeda TaxID=103827 RepID=A0A0N5CTR2_THECL|nr:unnamed protein product [Thelazia callipaeda]
MNSIALAQEIVALCPRCVIFGPAYYSSIDQCLQRISTDREGWPKPFQWCDLFQSSDNCIAH